MQLRIPSANSAFWSLADQAMVSGSNFVCGILLARVMGLEAFGAYVVAQTYLLYANTFQAALVVTPMMTAVPAESTETRRHELLRSFFGYTILVVVLTLVVVQGVAYFLGQWSSAIGLGGLALPLGVAMAGFQLQDWSRRACYSEARTRQVFLGDLVAYGGQFVLLISLASLGQLHPATALWSMASAFIASLTVMLMFTRLWPDIRGAFDVIRSHWRASGNYFVSWQLQWLGSSGVILLGAGMIGAQAAGAIRAVQNLFGPINVGFQWMDNIVPVRSAARLRDMGRGALRAYLWRFGLVGILGLGTFAGLLALVDEPLIVLLYGEAYRPYAVLVVFQALYYLFGHAYRMASYFQRATGQSRELAIASAWWAAIALLAAFSAVGRFADRGIMLALLLGEVAGLIYLLSRRRIELNDATHCVLRRSDGSTQLLLPTANLQLGHAALQMYYPSRWSGRLYRTALKWTLRMRLAMRIAEMHPPLEKAYPHIDAVLSPDRGSAPKCMGVLVSAPGPNSKLTIKLMDEQANVLAYARLAYGEQAIAAIRREATVLQLLAASTVAAQVPEVLKHADLADPPAYCLVESAGPEQASDHNLSTLHFDFLSQLVTADKISWTKIVRELCSEIATTVSGTILETTCMTACDFLQNSTVDLIPTCIEHGDFAPWNIRCTAEGSLFFIDWEHARLDGLPWMDALHFCYQWAVLVKRQAPTTVLASLREVFAMPASANYRNVLPELVAFKEPLIMIYLLRKLVVGKREGKLAGSMEQMMCVDLLKMLIKAAR